MRFLQPALNPRATAWVVHGEVDQAEPFSRRLLGAGVAAASLPEMQSIAEL